MRRVRDKERLGVPRLYLICFVSIEPNMYKPCQEEMIFIMPGRNRDPLIHLKPAVDIDRQSQCCRVLLWLHLFCTVTFAFPTGITVAKSESSYLDPFVLFSQNYSS